MNAIEIRVAGADMYCPDCRRRLASVMEDGSVTIADRAVVSVRARVDLEGETGEGVLVDARCLRLLCRARAWLWSLR